MCVVSMVYDHYDKIFPTTWPEIQPVVDPIPGTFTPPTGTFTTLPFSIISKEEIEALQKLIGEFKQAVEAAKTVDKLTKQPDCEDPVKKKLEDRVAILEEQVAQLFKTIRGNDDR